MGRTASIRGSDEASRFEVGKLLEFNLLSSILTCIYTLVSVYGVSILNL